MLLDYGMDEISGQMDGDREGVKKEKRPDDRQTAIYISHCPLNLRLKSPS